MLAATAAGPGGAGGGFGSGRPLVMAVLLLLLFFSAQSDWSSGQTERKLNKEQRVAKDGAAEKRESVKEKIILDLSLANEKLEEINQRLKIEVLALRRSVRACGGELPPTNLTFLGTPLSELLSEVPMRASSPPTTSTGGRETPGPRAVLEAGGVASEADAKEESAKEEAPKGMLRRLAESAGGEVGGRKLGAAQQQLAGAEADRGGMVRGGHDSAEAGTATGEGGGNDAAAACAGERRRRRQQQKSGGGG